MPDDQATIDKPFALDFMLAAVEVLDGKYGRGFALGHGDVLMALMLSATLERATAAITQAVEHLRMQADE